MQLNQFISEALYRKYPAKIKEWLDFNVCVMNSEGYAYLSAKFVGKLEKVILFVCLLSLNTYLLDEI